MKNLIKKIFFPLVLALLISSCQKEVLEVTDTTNPQEVLVASSKLSNLLNYVVKGNSLISGKRCFKPQLPITVIANGTEVLIERNKDFRKAIDIFNESDTDTDTLEVDYPITVIYEDDTEIVVNSQDELETLIAACEALTDDDNDDDDIVIFGGKNCFKVKLPATVNANGTEVVIENRRDYRKVRDIFNEFDTDVDTLEIVFPISVKQDNEDVVVNSQDELDAIIAECALNDDDDHDDHDDKDCSDIFGGNNCFRVKLPVRVTANGRRVLLEDRRDYRKIKDIFRESDTDVDTLEIVFPITVKQDNEDVVVNSQDELNAIIAECELSDDYYEYCIIFDYPITASIYDAYNQVINTITIRNDRKFEKFLKILNNSNIVVSLNFPISLELADGTAMEVNSNDELFAVLDACE